MIEEILGDLKKTLEENTATTKELVEQIKGLHDYIEKNDVDVSPPVIVAEPTAEAIKKSAAKKAAPAKDNVEQLKPKEEKQDLPSIDDLRLALKDLVAKHWANEPAETRKQELGKFINQFGGGAQTVPKIAVQYYADIIEKSKLPLDEIYALYEDEDLKEAA